MRRADWVSKGLDPMKKTILMAAAFAAMLFGAVAESKAESLEAVVDISSQTMTVSQYGNVLYMWKVSTARNGYVTPRGTYRPQRMNKMWYSRKYDMSPMPFAVFYHGGYAVHGTYEVRHIGRPASHGCVRLQTANAATFYSLVQRVGMANTKIMIVN
jgi:lipoprotein-anchoring transpeptidase ErfK/SrfK